MAYRPKLAFVTPLTLLIPTKTTVKGVMKKQYEEIGTIYCSFRTFGGTERESNSILSVENTAVIETWYRPDIKADCAVKTMDGAHYEILGTPEDIEQRHQFLRFKIREIKGGA